MSFLKKYKIVIGIGIVVLTVGTFISLHDKTLSESVVIYKTTEPAPRKQQTRSTDHSHNHDTVSRSRTPQITQSGTYDWRNDNAFDASRFKADPWKQAHPDEEKMKTAPESAEGETYPPVNWELTEDPKLRAEYLYAVLLNQFGDIPEVHTIGDYELKAAEGLPATYDEYITYLEAHLSLWPSKVTQQTLERIKKVKAEGVHIVFKGRTQ